MTWGWNPLPACLIQPSPTDVHWVLATPPGGCVGCGYPPQMTQDKRWLKTDWQPGFWTLQPCKHVSPLLLWTQRELEAPCVSTERGTDKEVVGCVCVCVCVMEYYSAMKGGHESLLVRWLTLQTVTEWSESERDKDHILTRIYGTYKDGTDEPTWRAGIEMRT